MKYRAFFAAKTEPDRNFDIKYAVCEEKDSYYIMAFVEGGIFSEKAVLGSCCEENAVRMAEFFAEKGVHPVHIEDIISDLRF